MHWRYDIVMTLTGRFLSNLTWIGYPATPLPVTRLAPPQDCARRNDSGDSSDRGPCRAFTIRSADD